MPLIIDSAPDCITHNEGSSAKDLADSFGGEITFSSLFSGDPNEDNAEDRLTEATFSAKFADPRKAIPGLDNNVTFPPDVVSDVSGKFRFYFQRGQPAQRFP